MNVLSVVKKIKIIQLLVEGNSLRAISRLVSVDIHTVIKILIETGKSCFKFHDTIIRNIKSKCVQCDELWTFCNAKKKNVSYEDRKLFGYGDAWVWVSIDADSKLIINWIVGDRSIDYAELFLYGLAERLANRIQLSTDGYSVYVDAVRKVFGDNIDYAMLFKIYDNRSHFVKSEKRIIIGNPDMQQVSTSYIERQNLNIRMGNKRFSRKTNAFSKKKENLLFSLALTFMYHNFVRIHSTLRTTPAMAAGISDHVWSFEELVSMAPKPVAKKRGPYKKRA